MVSKCDSFNECCDVFVTLFHLLLMPFANDFCDFLYDKVQ